jgi:hypothetical protein
MKNKKFFEILTLEVLTSVGLKNTRIFYYFSN